MSEQIDDEKWLSRMGLIMTQKQLHILQHSLGVDKYGQGHQYRNRFVTGPEGDDFAHCVALVKLGYMEGHGPQSIAGGMHCFCVTKAGKRAVVDNSDKPPTLSRSQKRYREYLNGCCDMKFGEWLKLKRV